MSQVTTPDNNVHAVAITSTGAATKLLDAVLVTGAGAAFQPISAARTFQARLTCTGGGNCTATVAVEVSNDNLGWINLGTITFGAAGTGQTDGLGSVLPWKYVRGNCSAITGTNAALTLTMGQ